MKEKRILIVEDECVVALDIAKRLNGLGYGVSTIVSSGEEACESVWKDQPDLILMDIELGGNMDGIEAAAQIQSAYNIPVVYLTAYADEEALEKAKVTEPFVCVLKPFETKDLQVAVESALYKRRTNKNEKGKQKNRSRPG